MFRRLLPRESNFFQFFDQHAALAVRAAKELQVACEGKSALDIKAAEIKELEREADGVTHRCTDALHATFITPIERTDIHQLIARLDDVVDLVDAVAARMALYEISVPSTELADLAAALVSATESVERAVNKLRDMKNAPQILDECKQVNKAEKRADIVHASALAKLFKEERDAIKVIKWREIYETIEDAVDACADISDLVEGIVLEHV